jgi:2-polyprenyl-6-methoxyphenol hydroxylase-like FAD-dependent oxidoreductase
LLTNIFLLSPSCLIQPHRANPHISNMRVLIIGGGIGGLSLAHGLRKAGIDVRVFEQQVRTLQSAWHDRVLLIDLQVVKAENLAGYGIHIDRNGRQALRYCLPLSNWARLQTLMTSAGTQLFFRDTQLRVLAEKNDVELSGKSAQEVERSGVGRLDLRDVLIDGLDNGNTTVIQWGRAFTQFEKLDNGQIRAHFADGAYEDGDILVGADGPNSVVRHQFLPHIERLDLGVSAIAGRYILNDKRVAMFPPEMTNGALNNIVPSGRGWMFISAWRSRPADSDGFTESEHYIVWAYIAPSSDITQSGDSVHGPDLHQYVLDSIKGWAPELRELVAGSDTSTTKCLSLRSMPILTPWEPSNVTLLGDAIHNMTPMGGMGANTALRDAEALTRCLIDVAAGRLSINESVGTYEEEMRVYSNDAIKLSTSNTINACKGGTTHRLVFRSILRAAQTFPLIMRATIGRSSVKQA